MKIIWNKVTWYSELLAVIVLAGAICLGFYFKSEFKKVSDIKPVEVQSQSDIDTKDWKTYRNEKYGFEFKYPESFIIEGAVVPNEIITVKLPDYRTTSIQCVLMDMSDDDYYQIDDVLEGKYEKNFGKFDKVALDRKSIVRFYPQEDLGGDKSQMFYLLNFPSKGQILDLNCSANPFNLYSKIINQILLTFKSIK